MPTSIQNAENSELIRLLNACRVGDRKSQEKIYQQFYGFAMAVCMRYARSKDEAVEIVNDGFYKIFVNLDKYSPNLSFKGWVRRIMVNCAIDHFRRNEKHYDHVDISFVKTESLTPDILDQLNEETILKAVQELPPSYRIIFNLYAIEGFKHSEIAQKLDISEGTSKSNLNVARVKLKKALNLGSDTKSEQHG